MTRVIVTIRALIGLFSAYSLAYLLICDSHIGISIAARRTQAKGLCHLAELRVRSLGIRISSRSINTDHILEELFSMFQRGGLRVASLFSTQPRCRLKSDAQQSLPITYLVSRSNRIFQGHSRRPYPHPVQPEGWLMFPQQSVHVSPDHRPFVQSTRYPLWH
jgi:hypothetical protein